MELSIQMDTGPAQRWLEAFGKRLGGAIGRAIRRTGTAIQKDAIDLFRSRGVGRTIFGKDKGRKAARAYITRRRLRTAEGYVELPIAAKGLAAIQERAGRTAPHTILPKNAKVLAGMAAGKVFFAKSVRHPGSNIPSIPFLIPAGQRNAARLGQEMEKELEKLKNAGVRP